MSICIFQIQEICIFQIQEIRSIGIFLPVHGSMRPSQVTKGVICLFKEVPPKLELE